MTFIVDNSRYLWYSRIAKENTNRGSFYARVTTRSRKETKMFQLISRNEEGILIPSDARLMHFPAGEAHIGNTEHLKETPEMVFIQGAEAEDLVMLAMASDYARQMGNGLTALMPYLPGARADRGVPFGAKVYADLINAMNLKEIICFDPHSPVMPALLKRVTILDTVEIIKRTILQTETDYAGIISPDEGSRRRAGRIAKAAGIPMIKADKHRDFETQKLSGFSCEELPDRNGRYLIVDDICDSGGTFIGLAETIGLPKEQLDIWVSHGVFGLKSPRLVNHFNKIYTTNSHPGSSNPAVGAKVIDILPYLMELA